MVLFQTEYVVITFIFDKTVSNTLSFNISHYSALLLCRGASHEAFH